MTGFFTQMARGCDAISTNVGYSLDMDASLLSRLPLAAQRRAAENKPEPVERLVLNRSAREVRLYLRHNRYKKCISDLSPDQVSALLASIKNAGKEIATILCLDENDFAFSSLTRKQIE